MKKVLFIAYLYPPIFNSGTRRSLEFVNHLPDSGWTPVVLTVADPDPKDCDLSLLNEVRPNTRVERAPLWGVYVAQKVGPLLPLSLNAERVAQGLSWRIQRLWDVPDSCGSWVPRAVVHARHLHTVERFDVIYATGWPWSSFLIAEKVSRATGVPFVLDYRDLWQSSDAEWDKCTWLQRHLNPLLEKRVLRRASGVITTTKSFLKLLPHAHLPGNQFVITNGYDEKDFQPSCAVPAARGEKITIAYTGVWRPGYGPDDLFAAIRLLQSRGAPSLSKLHVVTAGFPPGRAKEFGIDAIVEERGTVSHRQALEIMSSANAVYLPVSSGLYEQASIPGKLFEYLGSGRPILACAKPGSEVARLLDEVGGSCRIDPGDVGNLANKLEALCLGVGSFSERIPAKAALYTRANLTRQLAAALDTVVRQPRA